MRDTLELINPADKPNSKFRAITDIMKDPQLKAKLNNMIDEAVRCKQRIHGEQQAIKDIRDAAREDVGLNPKLFNYYVAAVFNNDYAQRKTSLDELSTLIDTIMAIGLQDDVPGDD